MVDPDVKKLVDAVEALPAQWAEWPGGWPGEVEAALIDAVLSIRAKYGSETTGVRAAIRRYRDAQDEEPLDSLRRLAAYDPQALQEILGVSQKTSGVPKAEAIVEAARALGLAGVEHAADVDPKSHKSAYTSVHGLGWVTWDYFTMLLGKPGVKTDTWIVLWVREAVGDDRVTAETARRLLHEAAEELKKDDPDLDLSRLDHVIWKHARSAGRG
jgi:hypothetical protein